MSDGNVEFHLLLQRLTDRDPEAVDEFLTKYSKDLRRVVRRMLHEKLRTQFDSLDFLQSVWGEFFALPADKIDFSDSEALKAFLLDLTANKVIDAFRSRFQTQRRNLNRENSLHGSARAAALRLTAQDPTPSQDVMAREAWDHLVQGLPESSRTIVRMLSEGCSNREIAQELSISERTVARLVHKLRPRLLA